MRNHLGALPALLLTLFIAACGTLPQSVGTNIGGRTTTTEMWVGVLAIEQTPQVDREALGRTEGQYFFAFYDRDRHVIPQRPGLTGVTDTVTISIRQGRQVYWSDRIQVQNGIARVAVPVGTPIPVNAALCVETPWAIAHQSRRPSYLAVGEHGACSAGQAFYDYLFTSRHPRTGQPRALTPLDAYGLIVIKSRGQP